jgi:peptidylprolyl isomerase
VVRLTQTLRAALVAAAVTLAVASCGSSTPKESFSSTSGCAIGVSLNTKAKPAINVPSCAVKPTTLQSKTITPGTGTAAVNGDTVVVKYIGFSWDTHKEFDASWDNGLNTFPVTPLGQAQVIAGWNQGLVGAKKGERRLLVIPPTLGYGAEGSAPAITPNETLVFVVDVVSVSS